MNNEQIEINAFHSENKLKANVRTVLLIVLSMFSFCVEMGVNSWGAPALAMAFSNFFLVGMSGDSNKCLWK